MANWNRVMGELRRHFPNDDIDQRRRRAERVISEAAVTGERPRDVIERWAKEAGIAAPSMLH